MTDSYKNHCLAEDSEAVRNGAGKNIIPPPEKDPLWKLYLEKFKDPIIIVLLVVCFCIAVAPPAPAMFWNISANTLILQLVSTIQTFPRKANTIIGRRNSSVYRKRCRSPIRSIVESSLTIPLPSPLLPKGWKMNPRAALVAPPVIICVWSTLLKSQLQRSLIILRPHYPSVR